MIFEIEIGQIQEVNRKKYGRKLNTQLSTYSGNRVLQSTHLTKISSSKFKKVKGNRKGRIERKNLTNQVVKR